MSLNVVNEYSFEVLNLPIEKSFSLLYNIPEVKEYITKLAYKYWYKTSRLWDVDDYMQYLRIGLLEAIERFKINPQKTLAHHIYNRFKFNLAKANQLCYSKKEIKNSTMDDLDTVLGAYTEDISERVIFQVALEASLEKYIQRSFTNKKRVIMFLYRMEGYTVKQICKEMNCSDSYVYECLNSVKRYLKSEGLL